ncbi:hypothetical protein GTA28_29000 [Rhodococcus hoagii]|nr:hypothetical protein [Prescottella equi]
MLANDTDLGDAVRQMAMRTQVLRGDQYLHVLGRASGALWNHEADRAAYVEKWLQVLAADALRAVDRAPPRRHGSPSPSTSARRVCWCPSTSATNENGRGLTRCPE